jgi:hypothetical protein
MVIDSAGEVFWTTRFLEGEIVGSEMVLKGPKLDNRCFHGAARAFGPRWGERGTKSALHIIGYYSEYSVGSSSCNGRAAECVCPKVEWRGWYVRWAAAGGGRFCEREGK